MNWHYFACTRCNHTFRTTIDNPDYRIECAYCNYALFNEITKDDYDKARKSIKPPEVFRKQ